MRLNRISFSRTALLRVTVVLFVLFWDRLTLDCGQPVPQSSLSKIAQIERFMHAESIDMKRNRLMPDFLSHYYEASRGPFFSLSDLPLEEAEVILCRIQEKGSTFASQRDADYLSIRRDLETQVRQQFVAKGGVPQRLHPHYMILGSCPWVKGWYLDGRELRIPLSKFDPSRLSFTYGDTFPTMRYEDGKPYRKQVYTLDELPTVIAAYGLPQELNPEGELGPDRYIEAQIWDDGSLNYLDPA